MLLTQDQSFEITEKNRVIENKLIKFISISHKLNNKKQKQKTTEF